MSRLRSPRCSTARRRAPIRAIASPSAPSSTRRGTFASRRFSSTARRCRCTRSKGAISTATATSNDITAARLSLHRAERRRRRRRFEETGTCETVNCSRRASFSQLNLRVSRAFPLWRHRAHRGDRRDLQPLQREESVHSAHRRSALSATGAPLARSCSRRRTPATSSSRSSGSDRSASAHVLDNAQCTMALATCS